MPDALQGVSRRLPEARLEDRQVGIHQALRQGFERQVLVSAGSWVFQGQDQVFTGAVVQAGRLQQAALEGVKQVWERLQGGQAVGQAGITCQGGKDDQQQCQAERGTASQPHASQRAASLTQQALVANMQGTGSRFHGAVCVPLTGCETAADQIFLWTALRNSSAERRVPSLTSPIIWANSNRRSFSCRLSTTVSVRPSLTCFCTRRCCSP